MTTEKNYSKEESNVKKKKRTLKEALLTWINIKDEYEETDIDWVCCEIAHKAAKGDFKATKLLKDIIDDKTYTLNINLNINTTQGGVNESE